MNSSNEPITSLLIPETREIPSSQASILGGGRVTVFLISVKGPVKSYTLTKRYSEFDALNSQLSSLTHSPPPVELPGKAFLMNFTSSAVEQRRAGLERYLQAILYDKDVTLRRSRPWASFFNLPDPIETSTPLFSSTFQHNHSSASRNGSTQFGEEAPPIEFLDPINWMQEYESLYSLSSQIRSVLNERDRQSANGDSTGAHSKKFQARKGLKVAQDTLDKLTVGLQQQQHGRGGHQQQLLAIGEFSRRQDMLRSMRDELEALEESARTSTGTGSGNMNGDFRGRSSSSSRAELVLNSTSGASGGARTGRKFGVAVETEKTRTLDNHGLLQLQDEEMNLQDNALVSLASVIRRQKEISLAIGNELDEQNVLLEQLDDSVNVIDGRMKIADKKIKRILK